MRECNDSVTGGRPRSWQADGFGVKRIILFALPILTGGLFLAGCDDNDDKPADAPTWTVTAVPPVVPSVSVSASPSVSASASPSESVSTKVVVPTTDASCDPHLRLDDPDC